MRYTVISYNIRRQAPRFVFAGSITRLDCCYRLRLRGNTGMNSKRTMIVGTATVAALAVAGYLSAQQQNDEPPEFGFFITSVGIGDGADLGGLQGADAHCQSLAQAADAGHRTWRAYLSTQGNDAVNARDRIGAGPWANAKGLVIATNVDNLHYDNSNINFEHALNESGNPIPSRIDGDPDYTEHDILTGSRMDGTAFPPGEDRTCSNWTSSEEGSAMVGHHDRYSFSTPGASWNSSHATPGCSQEALVRVGGAGLLYCFAAD